MRMAGMRTRQAEAQVVPCGKSQAEDLQQPVNSPCITATAKSSSDLAKNKLTDNMP